MGSKMNQKKTTSDARTKTARRGSTPALASSREVVSKRQVLRTPEPGFNQRVAVKRSDPRSR
jgi:hypothetical protein